MVKCSNIVPELKPSCKECPNGFCDSPDCEKSDIDNECVAKDNRVDSTLSDVLRSIDLNRVSVLGGN